MENKTIYYYYDLNNSVRYLEDEDDEIKVMKTKDLYKLMAGKNHIFRPKGEYDNTDEDLIKYKEDFNIDCKEARGIKLKTRTGKYFSINYKKYESHNDAVFCNWMKHYVEKGMYSLFQKVKEFEFYIIERCYNGGLITLNLDHKNKVIQCHSRDYSSFYPRLMATMKIPSEDGKLYTFKQNELEFGKLKYGIYRVKITYTNPKLTNVFNFSEDNHYTSQTLNGLFKYKEFFGITFTLLDADKTFNYNALIYEYEQLIDGKTLFGEWLDDMLNAKKQIPKNILIKHLTSTLAGTLQSFKKVHFKSFKDIDLTRINSNVESDYKLLKKNDDNKYECVKSDDAYKYKLARIKPFIVAIGRSKVLSLIMDNDLLDYVVSIHTDRICLTKDFDYSKSKKKYRYVPLPEAKSTGNIIFHSCVDYKHVCLSCNTEYRYKDGHKC